MDIHGAASVLIAVFPAALLAGQSGGAISIPEPTDLWLFGIGVAGLLIGRRAAVKREKKDKDT